jgi:hypothetical protein
MVASSPTYFHVFRDATMDSWMDLLTTYLHHSELLISTIHRSPQQPISPSPACCVFNSRFLATVANSGHSSASRAHVVTLRRISRDWTLVDCQQQRHLFSAFLAELDSAANPEMTTDNSTNWVPGWRPFHTSLLVVPLQADSQLTTEFSHEPATSRHFTQLNCWQLPPTTNSLLDTVLRIPSRHGPYRKHRFYCFSSTIPRPLHRNGCLFIRNGCCLQSNCLATDLYATVRLYTSISDWLLGPISIEFGAVERL